ncbi:hypothetical protein TELCIR_09558 [Teladorsagia circumcincta]|uniref:Autophagy-related protein 9 n=1 Tax=Teladorsagia circumcincta TaxID=45464 RepID=A0A2G9UEG7_TELCI|nr:hypothetical protein TELCIR_09558 [Teladorsagia circumcincta]
MDVARHGDVKWNGSTSHPTAAPAFDGKTELSILHFASNNPEWKCPPATEQFLQRFRAKLEHDVNAAMQPVGVGEERNLLLDSMHSIMPSIRAAPYRNNVLESAIPESDARSRLILRPNLPGTSEEEPEDERRRQEEADEELRRQQEDEDAHRNFLGHRVGLLAREASYGGKVLQRKPARYFTVRLRALFISFILLHLNADLTEVGGGPARDKSKLNVAYGMKKAKNGKVKNGSLKKVKKPHGEAVKGTCIEHKMLGGSEDEMSSRRLHDMSTQPETGDADNVEEEEEEEVAAFRAGGQIELDLLLPRLIMGKDPKFITREVAATLGRGCLAFVELFQVRSKEKGARRKR